MRSQFVELLKACATKKDLHEGARLHAHILEQHGLLETSPHIATTLISMYAKCGAVQKAHQLFMELPDRDVVSWNALIAGYAQHGQTREAFNLLERMKNDGISPNPITFTSALKACGSSGIIGKGQQIHDEIVARGFLEKNIIVLGNALVGMYAKCGMLAEAQQMLERLPIRDVVSWSALIAGYAEQGCGNQALSCLDEMQKEGITPNEITFVCVLKACRSIGAIEKGKQIHNEIAKMGLLKKSVMLGNALVDLYSKCGMLAKAQEVLEELHIRDVVSWNSLIAGHVLWNQGHAALSCFERMQRESISPDQVTFICILKACGHIGDPVKGNQIHDDIVNRGLLEKNIVLGSALVDMYAKCGVLTKAKLLLDELPCRDVVSWSALIAGYTQEGQDREALNCFEQMQREGVCPNAVTFICILKSCGSIGAIDKGKQIHDEIINRGLLSDNAILGNALVDMYAKCGFLIKAQQVLEEHPHRNVVSWNALIAGYVQHKQGQEAMRCFERMQKEGLAPNEATIISILKSCGDIGAIREGKRLHIDIVNNAFLEKNTQLGNALVDMYAKCGFLAKARQVLEDLPNRNTVSWNTLMVGYTQDKQGHAALECFEQMLWEGHSPDNITFTCILKACGSVGAIEKGKNIHDTILNKGLLQNNIVLGNALVDMYAKCGAFIKAQEVLNELPEQDTISWSALIAGYALRGRWLEALNCFEQMQREGHSPNEVTLLCVLDACNHSGKLDDAERYYENMSKIYGITPTSEHHTCMVVGFGSVGRFDKVLSVIKKMPCFLMPSVWLRLLGSCKKWGNVKLGRLAFDQAMKLDNTLSAGSSIYGTADKVEATREDIDTREKTEMSL